MLRKINSESKHLDGIEISPRSIITIQNYMDSKENDKEDENQNICPIGIYDAIKNYLGLSIEFYRDLSNGSLLVKELFDENTCMIRFKDADDIANYVEYLTYLSIYCKLHNSKLHISRDNKHSSEKYIIEVSFEERMKRATEKYGDEWKKHLNEFENYEDEIKTYDSNFFRVISVENDGQELQLPIEEAKKDILQQWNSMSIYDINRINLSQYEFRKIIAAQYSNVALSREECEAISLYKHGYFDKVNGFLRGDLSFLKDVGSEEHFWIEEIPQVVEIIDKLYDCQKRLSLDRDITVLRRDNQATDIQGETLIYDNFVSTTITPQLFRYSLDGITGSGVEIITVPKGSFFFPTDICQEQMMNFEESVKPFQGDTGYEEGEILLPMCKLKVLEKRKNIVTARVEEQYDPFNIITQRAKEYKDRIIQHGGIEAYKKVQECINRVIKTNVQDKKDSDEVEV
jgi:hypothetical protein